MTAMQLGLIGLGKMGGNMRERIRRAGHTVIGYDRNPEVTDVESLAELVGKLEAPRTVWVMVPAGAPTQSVVDELGDLLEPGDVIVDGGNSRWTDDEKHAEELGAKGIGFVDAGVSGGVWGLKNGYALMVGGDAENIAKVQPIFDALKPEGEFGFVHAGKVGAGHFSKMVHNGIEYAMMQAYAEGWELLEKVHSVTDVREVFRSWQEGTVIRSWLLDLAVNALDGDEHLDKLKGYAEDSGEGRWTVEAAIDNAVPLPAITASLFARFASRQDDSPQMKMVAALRETSSAATPSSPSRRAVGIFCWSATARRSGACRASTPAGPTCPSPSTARNRPGPPRSAPLGPGLRSRTDQPARPRDTHRRTRGHHRGRTRPRAARVGLRRLRGRHHRRHPPHPPPLVPVDRRGAAGPCRTPGRVPDEVGARADRVLKRVDASLGTVTWSSWPTPTSCASSPHGGWACPRRTAACSSWRPARSAGCPPSTTAR